MSMNIAAVFYTYDSARADDLAAVRPKHRDFLRSLREEGKLLASGPLSPGGALIVVRARAEEEALVLLDGDPMRTAGLVTKRSARMWEPVIGPFGE